MHHAAMLSPRLRLSRLVQRALTLPPSYCADFMSTTTIPADVAIGAEGAVRRQGGELKGTTQPLFSGAGAMREIRSGATPSPSSAYDANRDLLPMLTALSSLLPGLNTSSISSTHTMAGGPSATDEEEHEVTSMLHPSSSRGTWLMLKRLVLQDLCVLHAPQAHKAFLLLATSRSLGFLESRSLQEQIGSDGLARLGVSAVVDLAKAAQAARVPLIPKLHATFLQSFHRVRWEFERACVSAELLAAHRPRSEEEHRPMGNEAVAEDDTFRGDQRMESEEPDGRRHGLATASDPNHVAWLSQLRRLPSAARRHASDVERLTVLADAICSNAAHWNENVDEAKDSMALACASLARRWSVELRQLQDRLQKEEVRGRDDITEQSFARRVSQLWTATVHSRSSSAPENENDNHTRGTAPTGDVALTSPHHREHPPAATVSGSSSSSHDVTLLQTTLQELMVDAHDDDEHLLHHLRDRDEGGEYELLLDNDNTTQVNAIRVAKSFHDVDDVSDVHRYHFFVRHRRQRLAQLAFLGWCGARMQSKLGDDAVLATIHCVFSLLTVCDRFSVQLRLGEARLLCPPNVLLLTPTTRDNLLLSIALTRCRISDTASTTVASWLLDDTWKTVLEPTTRTIAAAVAGGGTHHDDGAAATDVGDHGGGDDDLSVRHARILLQCISRWSLPTDGLRPPFCLRFPPATTKTTTTDGNATIPAAAEKEESPETAAGGSSSSGSPSFSMVYRVTERLILLLMFGSEHRLLSGGIGDLVGLTDAAIASMFAFTDELTVRSIVYYVRRHAAAHFPTSPVMATTTMAPRAPPGSETYRRGDRVAADNATAACSPTARHAVIKSALGMKLSRIALSQPVHPLLEQEALAAGITPFWPANTPAPTVYGRNATTTHSGGPSVTPILRRSDTTSTTTAQASSPALLLKLIITPAQTVADDLTGGVAAAAASSSSSTTTSHSAATAVSAVMRQALSDVAQLSTPDLVWTLRMAGRTYARWLLVASGGSQEGTTNAKALNLSHVRIWHRVLDELTSRRGVEGPTAANAVHVLQAAASFRIGAPRLFLTSSMLEAAGGMLAPVWERLTNMLHRATAHYARLPRGAEVGECRWIHYPSPTGARRRSGQDDQQNAKECLVRLRVCMALLRWIRHPASGFNCIPSPRGESFADREKGSGPNGSAWSLCIDVPDCIVHALSTTVAAGLWRRKTTRDETTTGMSSPTFGLSDLPLTVMLQNANLICSGSSLVRRLVFVQSLEYAWKVRHESSAAPPINSTAPFVGIQPVAMAFACAGLRGALTTAPWLLSHLQSGGGGRAPSDQDADEAKKDVTFPLAASMLTAKELLHTASALPDDCRLAVVSQISTVVRGALEQVVTSKAPESAASHSPHHPNIAFRVVSDAIALDLPVTEWKAAFLTLDTTAGEFSRTLERWPLDDCLSVFGRGMQHKLGPVATSGWKHTLRRLDKIQSVSDFEKICRKESDDAYRSRKLLTPPNALLTLLRLCLQGGGGSANMDSLFTKLRLLTPMKEFDAVGIAALLRVLLTSLQRRRASASDFVNAYVSEHALSGGSGICSSALIRQQWTCENIADAIIFYSRDAERAVLGASRADALLTVLWSAIETSLDALPTGTLTRLLGSTFLPGPASGSINTLPLHLSGPIIDLLRRRLPSLECASVSTVTRFGSHHAAGSKADFWKALKNRVALLRPLLDDATLKSVSNAILAAAP